MPLINLLFRIIRYLERVKYIIFDVHTIRIISWWLPQFIEILSILLLISAPSDSDSNSILLRDNKTLESFFTCYQSNLVIVIYLLSGAYLVDLQFTNRILSLDVILSSSFPFSLFPLPPLALSPLTLLHIPFLPSSPPLSLLLLSPSFPHSIMTLLSFPFHPSVPASFPRRKGKFLFIFPVLVSFLCLFSLATPISSLFTSSSCLPLLP